MGDKKYELSNHLGNVLSVVGDRKTLQSSPKILDQGTIDYNSVKEAAYTADQQSQLKQKAKAAHELAQKTLQAVKQSYAVMGIMVDASDNDLKEVERKLENQKASATPLALRRIAIDKAEQVLERP